MKSNINLCISIAGSDPTSGAGIQQDVKTMSKLGVICISIISCITYQNEKGVFGIYPLSFEVISRQTDVVLKNIKIKFGKTGALGNEDGVKAAIKIIEKYGVSLVVDPVLQSKNGFPLLSKGGFELMKKKLIPLSFFLTPNLNEAEKISEIKIEKKDDILKAGEKISKISKSFVIIKGGHTPEIPQIEKTKIIEDFLFFNGNFVKSFKKKKSNFQVHGTGCIFSAALTAFLTRGIEPQIAFAKASKWTQKAIEKSIKITNEGFNIFP
jgi:hydroxymethylpyrimidine/phosphomethylpyrimidine kinase